jgi:transposase
MKDAGMDAVFERAGGIDVHKESLKIGVRCMEGKGQVRKEVRSFGTTTRELLRARDWLAENQVTHVAMESTGVFWKPVYNILEGEFDVWLVNARHAKNVPGRKTDVKDAEWLAQLMQWGLLSKSFIPPRPQREWRDLTRSRAQLVHDKTRVANRIQKVLEDANIKLASVASDVLGVSGRAMLRRMVDGPEEPKALAALARGRLRGKIPQLEEALEGRMSDHHRFLLRRLLAQLEHLEDEIDLFERRIEELNAPFEEAVRAVAEIPGFDQTSASALIAEIGTDMKVFPSADHLSSWCGICPGNHESAGRQQSGKTRKGNAWLRNVLTQSAWAATRTKDSYFRAQYRRLAGRRGKRRAIVSVAHSLLVVIYHVLSTGRSYQDLGVDYFDHRDAEKIARHHIKRLESLGYIVTRKEAA